MSLDDSLDGVSEELADNILEVAEDVREAGGEVALDFDLGDGTVWAMDGTCEGLCGGAAVLDYVFGDTFDEDFADEVGVRQGGAGGE